MTLDGRTKEAREANGGAFSPAFQAHLDVVAEDRRKLSLAVLEAAIRVAEHHGVYQMTRAQIASDAGVSTGRVSSAYGSMPELREAVMQEAVSRRIAVIVCQGLAANSEIARNAPPDLKALALAVHA